MKRGTGGSPIDGPIKRARIGGKRPSKFCYLADRVMLMSAPEEHQRQAMEVAQRATVQTAHANSNFVPQPGHIQRQLSQVSQLSPAPLALDSQQSTGPRQMNDAERQYAAQQAAYARSQVMASPASYMSPVTSQSPSTLDAGTNGYPTKGGTAMKASLSVDVIDAVTPAAEATPVSALSTSSKKKTGGKKGAGGTGGKRKGGKGTQAQHDKADKEEGFVIPSTPTQQGGQGAELQYGQQQHIDYATSQNMSRAGTSESIQLIRESPTSHQTPNPNSSQGQSHQAQLPQNPPQDTTTVVQHDPASIMLQQSEPNGIMTTTDGDEDMFKMFTGDDYADVGDGMPQSANGGFNFDDFDVSILPAGLQSGLRLREDR
jgi:hypothetical protein